MTTTTTRIQIIHETRIRGHRLGRHIEHDPRSRAFELVVAPASAPLVSRAWKRHAPIFDQGDLGKCTCEAMGGCKMTEPFFDPSIVVSDATTTALYGEATRLDKIPGAYPPDDTGSSGIAAAKAATRRGWFTGYKHAFSLRAALAALQAGPVAIGINWYEGFDKPQGAHAELVIGGAVRGGHEVEINEIDVSRRLIRGPNSWSDQWGDHGFFCISFDTFERLLAEDGDVTIPRLDGAVA